MTSLREGKEEKCLKIDIDVDLIESLTLTMIRILPQTKVETSGPRIDIRGSIESSNPYNNS